jgi:Tfp pilus assembly protein PilO
LQIQDLADQAGVKFVAINPGDPVEEDGFEIIPLQLQFEGTFFDLSDFVYRAEQLVGAPGRLIAVKSVQMQLGGGTETEGSSAPAKKSPKLTVSMTLQAFCMSQTPAGPQPTKTTTTTAP